MKVADYVLEYLKSVGIKKVFQVYGAATGDLVDAFSRVKGIEYVAVMHEQGGAFAAEGYAKASGEIGCAMATSGPGGINLINGIANCYYDSTPCLFITGQINSKFLKKSDALRQVGFQENDIVSMVEGITKFAYQVKNPNDIKWALERAVKIALDGRQGAVLVDIPVDIQKAEIDATLLIGSSPYTQRFDIEKVDEQIEQFVSDFHKSKRPVLLVGGGARNTRVNALGRMLNIPVFPTWNAIDIICSDYPNYGGRVGTFGGAGRNFAIQNSDLLLSIGSRISGRITGGYVDSFAREAKKYIVDIDPYLLDSELQEVKGDVNIHCDSGQFIDRLISALPLQNKRHIEWLNQALVWRDKYQPCLPAYYNETRYVHPYVFIKELSMELDNTDTVVVDCGGNVVVAYQTLETKYGQRVFSSHGNSPMGFSFAGGIGACLAPNVKRVICLIGDGGFNMNIQELQTLKTYNIPLKTFIMNNHSYGITRQFQETNFQGRYLASGGEGYIPPDFIKIAKAYDIKTETISNHTELSSKIRKVLNTPDSIVCDVDMGMHSQYDPRIFGWKTPIEDMYPYLSREEFRSNMIIEPVEGWDKPSMPGSEVGTGLA